MNAPSRSLIPGTVELVILRTLERGEPLHGFAVSRRIRERSEGVLDLQDAALYQALNRMEREGLVAGKWGTSENNRRAKYYRLTRAGRGKLARETAFWNRYVAAMARVLVPGSGG